MSDRPAEALVLLRGAVWYAEREGLIRAEFRSRMNFSSWIQEDDRQETLDVTRRGMERAQRLGLETWLPPLAGNAMEAAFQLGEWDWVETTAAEMRSEETVIPWQSSPIYILQTIAAFRGDEARVAYLGDLVARLTQGHADPQLAANGNLAAILMAYARGELDTAAPAMDSLIGDDSGQDRVLGVLFGVAQRDAGRLARDRIVAGRADAAAQDIAAAGRAILLGDATELAALDEAVDRLDGTGHHLFAALFRRERALLAPDDPGARAAAQSAAAWLRGVGAVAPLAGLEPFLGPDGADPVEARAESATTA